ncbi:Rossmann-like and DUF2520 domain-containing protein [Austwickia chelonae]|uniref:DUF2520 domain-containing protein n=1 Tax=Austwickia chelonae NBRC 105200 TaxID=1184607 RepID=K6V4T8_9MICO|nr:Rossmann-like and DUF2520 domain-containing protein [Austwickia chelonae]GAB77183.1 hypothetical protein AUCHE_05_00870 [Austwickia chelonae NBRC 105200]
MADGTNTSTSFIRGVPRRIGIYGTGRLAHALAQALGGNDRELQLVLSGRDLAQVQALARQTGARISTPEELPEQSDLLLLLIADDAIADVAAELAALPGEPPDSVVHCSGAVELAVLRPFADRGSRTAAWHPLWCFPRGGSIQPCTWTVAGGEGSLATDLVELTRCLGGSPRIMTGGDRAGYHAAAVLASNLPMALLARACDLLVDNGFTRDEAVEALLPLARSAYAAVEQAGLPAGITGPAVRGDIGTLRRHLDALTDRPQTELLYRLLSLTVLDLVRSPEQDAHRELRQMLLPERPHH